MTRHIQGTPNKINRKLLIRKVETRSSRINNQSNERNCQSRVLYLAKLSFRNKNEIRMIPDKQKLRIHLSLQKK